MEERGFQLKVPVMDSATLIGSAHGTWLVVPPAKYTRIQINVLVLADQICVPADSSSHGSMYQAALRNTVW